MKVGSIALLTSVAFMSAIAFGLVNYVFFYQGDLLPLPTISKTWTYKPANFISRVVIIASSIPLLICHTSVYYATADQPGATFLLLVAVVATFCLAALGAVCTDDRSSECLSSSVLHKTFAVSYFLLIDFWMVCMTYFDKRKRQMTSSSGDGGFRQMALGFIALTSVVYHCLQLVGPPVGGVVGFQYMGEFEWTNVILILIYLNLFIQEHCVTTFFTLRSGNADSHHHEQQQPSMQEEEEELDLLEIENGPLSITTILVCFLTISLSYIVAASRGDFEPFPNIPEVSDLFVLPPGNSFARLGGVLGATMACLTFAQFQQVWRTWYTHWPLLSYLPLILAVASMTLLALANCISKVEDEYVHFIVVSLFFASFQLVTVILDRQCASKDLAPWWRAMNMISLTSKYRFFTSSLHLFALLELIDVIAMVGCLGAFAWFESVPLQAVTFVLSTRSVRSRDIKESEVVSKV